MSTFMLYNESAGNNPTCSSSSMILPLRFEDFDVDLIVRTAGYNATELNTATH